MHLCDIPHNKIPLVEIPTGLPLVYDRHKRCIRLLEDGDNTLNPLEKYNFGSAPELVFKLQHLPSPFTNQSFKKLLEELSEEDKMRIREEILIKLPK